MPMLNKDTIKQKTQELATNILQAVKDNKPEAVAEQFALFQQQIVEMSAGDTNLAQQQMDCQALASRGARQMTSKEFEYFQSVCEAMKSAEPKQALADVSKAMPVTVIDTVMDEVRSEHPLLNAIDFKNTTGAIKMIYSEDGTIKATWGALSTTITTELSKTIKVLDVTQNKLSAFLPVPQDMGDLGPTWLFNLAIDLLKEAIADGAEESAVDGSGLNGPVGMKKDLSTFASATGYSDKTAVVVTDFSPVNYGLLVSKIAKKANGKARKVNNVILIVNPIDYFTKVIPATTVRNANGEYVNNVLPIPTEIIQSEALEEGEAVLGIPKQYLMCIGSSSKEGKIQYDDSCQFVEDNRVYKAKLYGNGRPKDNCSFLLLDISGLTPVDQRVVIVNSSDSPIPTNEVDATLKSLKIGSLTLSPTFTAGTKTYTTTTTDASNKITATANSSTAEIAIKNGTSDVTNGSTATWADGANTVTITVTDGNDTETYTVTVTKS